MTDSSNRQPVFHMGKGRVEAFSDGVIAIIITIMVLELKVPHGDDAGRRSRRCWPVFLSYVLSFVYLGIYWNNHHHMLHAVPARQRRRALGEPASAVLAVARSRSPPAGWARTTSRRCRRRSTACVLLMAAIAYWILQTHDHRRAGAGLGARARGRRRLQGQALARRSTSSRSPLAFVSQWLSPARCTSLVALIWLVPDRRIEHALEQSRDG